MNQILYTETTKKRTKGPIEIKKIVLFFAISIILFGTILLGQGAYAMYKQKQEDKKNLTVPTIQIDKQEDNKAKITVTHDKVISQLIYAINDGEEQILEGNGTNTIETEIDLSVGKNQIVAKAIDINGKETVQETSFEVEADLNIELSVVGNKIKITAKDVQEGMNYITYKWNNDEETRVDVNEETPYSIEIETEIPVGLNTLTINAVNKNNVIRTKEQEVKGIRKPEITAYQEGEYIVITVTDEEGIETILHNLNGEDLQTIQGENQKEIVYKQQIVQGDNYVTVTVKSISGAETVFYGICKN